ncbi:phage head closure protein [Terrihabitans rhizophilus]|uniref:Phage head closure protein n=1 Tax=Terrihabitans rhizophilus TaxID=3092662 RepID=A0ABU4RNM9_9HYPH|nr:phage head closure protein [Terrihabitans sp. PJ23]MDX6806432.1 phage head closure protein [Terrihabitans sp. PJ23]
MKAGKLDRQLTLQRSTTAPNEFGTPVETWSTVATLRAELVSGGTDEAARAHGDSAETMLTFRTRYSPGVSVADRLTFEGRAYDIKALSEIGRRRELEIRALARGF